MKAKIYLDFNSTHPPYLPALAAAREFYLENFANSSGLSLASQRVNARLEKARSDIAELLHVAPKQIIFTSCATESNNLLIRDFFARRKNDPFRVLISPFEHPSVSETLKALPQTEIALGMETADADLICRMAVQNESGIILPAVERRENSVTPLLVDFSQALPKLAADADDVLKPQVVESQTQNGAYLTATGHKVGAGFGAGLIITPPDALKGTHLLAGGNQEHTLRAGSHNIEAIIALALALRHKLETNSHKIWYETTQTFEKILRENITPLHPFSIVGENANRAPGTTLLLLKDLAIDFLVMGLDKEEITVSTGTSCKSRSRTASEALLAMGYSTQEALSVVRLSYDQDLSIAAMQHTAATIAAVIAKIKS